MPSVHAAIGIDALNRENPRAAMDRVYRFQRHIYDATRKFFLFGRDELVDRMDVPPGAQVLEIGCGTARNLVRLARRAPGASLFGLDASANMLSTAHANITAAAVGPRVTLRCALAEHTSPELFALTRGFDAIFFSYALSMMPGWSVALDAALDALTPGGSVYVVDFADLAPWPRAARAAMRWWLARFGVHHRPEVLERFRALERERRVTLELTTFGGRYGYQARLTKSTDSAGPRPLASTS